MKRYTGCRDAEKQKIYYGDMLGGTYGIPPVFVLAKAVKYKGKPVIKTPEHKPNICALRTAVRCLFLTVREE